MIFNIDDLLSLNNGLNVYQVIQQDSGYIKLLCTNFEQVECISCDQSVYSYNTEFWINEDSFHLFKLIS